MVDCNGVDVDIELPETSGGVARSSLDRCCFLWSLRRCLLFLSNYVGLLP